MRLHVGFLDRGHLGQGVSGGEPLDAKRMECPEIDRCRGSVAMALQCCRCNPGGTNPPQHIEQGAEQNRDNVG